MSWRVFVLLLVAIGGSSAQTAPSVRLEPVETYGKGMVGASAISPDGSTVAVVVSRDIFFLDGGTLERTGTIPNAHDAAIRAIAYHPIGDHIIAVAADGIASSWDANRHIRTHRFDLMPDEEPNGAERWSIRIYPELAQFIRSTPNDPIEQVAVWRFDRDKPSAMSNWDTAHRYRWTEQTADMRYGAGYVKNSDGSASFVLKNAITDEPALTRPESAVPWYRFSADNQFIAIGTFDRLGFEVIRLETGKVVPLAKLSMADLASCGLTLPQYKLAKSPALTDGYTFEGRPLNRELMRLLPPERQEWARNWVISAGMRTCDAIPPAIESTYRDLYHTLPDMTFAFSRPASLWAIAVSGGEDVPELVHHIQLWDHETHRRVGVLKGHEMRHVGANGGRLEYVHALAFHPNGALLASGGEDRTIRLWHIPTQTLVATVTGHDSPVRYLAFSPDGSRLLSGGSDGRVIEWRVESSDQP
ncbi:MAG: WD40 repeat domain-containing protein [Candidatus Poribacteria bacterium]|nr:WD40 repeat domain-containing protein [Candidatus Poribacteria bacterium]